jgi:hypothetical protein
LFKECCVGVLFSRAKRVNETDTNPCRKLLFQCGDGKQGKSVKYTAWWRMESAKKRIKQEGD